MIPKTPCGLIPSLLPGNGRKVSEKKGIKNSSCWGQEFLGRPGELPGSWKQECQPGWEYAKESPGVHPSGPTAASMDPKATSIIPKVSSMDPKVSPWSPGWKSWDKMRSPPAKGFHGKFPGKQRQVPCAASMPYSRFHLPSLWLLLLCPTFPPPFPRFFRAILPVDHGGVCFSLFFPFFFFNGF